MSGEWYREQMEGLLLLNPAAFPIQKRGMANDYVGPED